jgi:iron complex transport system ATP-binding protein
VEEQLAVLVTLHDLNLVARLANRVALLSNGGIHTQGAPGEVLKPDILAQVYGVQIHVMSHPLNGNPLILAGE